MSFVVRRGLQSSSRLCARTKYTRPKPKPAVRSNVRAPTQTQHHDSNLRVTEPIPPSVANLKCPENHPLWQFFSEGKFMRSPEELDSESRSWTVAELRRKSFEDLHSLWYNCLKERNILARENHLLRNINGGQQDSYDVISEKIRTTMWRIRHVLSERDWAYKIAQNGFDKSKQAFLEECEQEFLQIDQDSDDQAFEMLTRLQYAVFGISEFIDENKVDRNFVDGIKYVANLKLKRFAPRNETIESFAQQPITDAGEAFVLFTCENTAKDVQEACDAIKELRADGNSVSKYDELNIVAQYMKQLSQAQQSKADQTVSA